MPKFNMYQSLHTTVIGPRASRSSCRSAPSRCTAAPSTASRRTGSTRRTAAPASTPTGRRQRRRLRDDMTWVRQLIDWQRETEDPGEFLDSLRFEINSAEVYVFTPARRRHRAADRADAGRLRLRVHTEVGHRCIGARVNGRLVPLESALDNGDVVEVFTSKAQNAGPSRDWLTFVKSPRARNKIRQWFTKERREEAIEQGKDAIAKQMRKEGLPLQRLLTHETLSPSPSDLHHRRRHRAVRRGRRGQRRPRRPSYAGSSSCSAARRAPPRTSPRRHDHRPSASVASRRRAATPASSSRACTDVWVKLARCCTPVPGDDDRRLRHPGRRGVGAPHRLRQRREPAGPAGADGRGRVGADRRSRCSWSRSRSRRSTAPGCCRDITRVLSDQHVNILSASVDDHPRPDRQVPVHVRDGRPQAPRPRAQGRPHRRRRLRRLPRHPVAPHHASPPRSDTYFTRSDTCSHPSDTSGGCRITIACPAMVPAREAHQPAPRARDRSRARRPDRR